MTVTSIDATTGCLLVGGRRVFPLGLSDPPPVDSTAPNGVPAWQEISDAGASFGRNYTQWTSAAAAEDLLAVGHQLDAAVAHGLQLWVALAGVDENLDHESLLTSVVNSLKHHPGLGVWKGADEPAHGHVPVAGLKAVKDRIHQLDPNHPIAIIEAPRAPSPPGSTQDRPLTVAAVEPYATTCDIHGVDIYPVSKPPGLHAGGPPVHTDIGVVGDVTRIVARATGRKAIWTTLQIAWSGVLPPHPLVFPTLQQARFMAYDAIIAGARGLFFFGGHLTQAMNARDRAAGWNWTYWNDVQRPLFEELSAPPHMEALTAPLARQQVQANASDISVSTRQAAGFLDVIAVRRGLGSGTVHFTGLPPGVGEGAVLAHPGGNPSRPVTASGGAFTDPSPFGAHNARVYRFPTGA